MVAPIKEIGRDGWFDQFPLLGDIYLRRELSGGAPGDVKETNAVAVRAAFAALRDIAGNANGGATHLVAEGPVESAGGGRPEHVDSQLAALYPHVQSAVATDPHFSITRVPRDRLPPTTNRSPPSPRILQGHDAMLVAHGPFYCRRFPSVRRLVPTVESWMGRLHDITRKINISLSNPAPMD